MKRKNDDLLRVIECRQCGRKIYMERSELGRIKHIKSCPCGNPQYRQIGVIQNMDGLIRKAGEGVYYTFSPVK